MIFKGELAKSELVIQTRLKHPYFNFCGYPSEKVQFGETTLCAAQRCLMREIGLTADINYRGLMHKLIVDEDRLVEDNYFFTYSAENVQGRLIAKGEGMENCWMAPEVFLKLKNRYEGSEDVFRLATTSNIPFCIEKEYPARGF